MSPQKKRLSIVSPAFNEAAVLTLYYENLVEIIQKMLHAYEWEIIFVDDGSSDATRDVLRELRRKDNRVKYIHLSRNFGHQAALTAGLRFAKGDAVVMMDCDMQHPVALIPEMIARWESGFDLVLTVREENGTTGFLKRVTSGFFYRIMKALSSTPIKPSSADFRLMSRKTVNAFLQFGEYHRFIRGLVSWMGFRAAELKYKPDARYAGASKYTLGKMLNLAFDGITSFSVVPLRISAILGIIIFFGTILYAFYAVIIWFIKPHSLQVGWTSLLVMVNLLGGAILLFIGLIGEYVGRIYEQVKMRPVYLIDELEGFEEEQEV